MAEKSIKKESIADYQGGVFAYLEKIASTGRSTAVFGEPIEKGPFMIINASEVGAAGGAGFGGSQGSGPSGEGGEGGGGGGGGSAFGRPVATIIIGPDGVQVEPIIDATKIAITFFSAAAAVILSKHRIKKIARGLRR